MFNLRILQPTGDIAQMDIEEYLLAVVPAEMPAEWPMAALQAQAVAARSYAVYAALHGGRHSVEGADLCSLSHCQNYLPAMRHLRASQACQTTYGIVLTYNDEIANTLYSAACGGRTAANIDVNGTEVLYLMSVSCPCSHEKMGHGVGMCQYGAAALAKLDLLGNSHSWQDILEWYYRGTTLMGLEELLSKGKPAV